jgi:small subunit ribosomal protein S13
LEDASKPNEEKTDKIKDKPEETKTGTTKTTEKQKLDEKPTIEEPAKEKKPEEKKKQDEPVPKTDKKPDQLEKIPDTTEKHKKTDLPVKEKKIAVKKKEKKSEEDDDFKYIVRIANTDIDGDKTVVRGLTSIKGIGMHMSSLIVNTTGINRNIKIGNLTDKQIDIINQTLIDIPKIAPGWMMNHRKDYETGEDIHLVGSEIDMRIRDEINIMKKIRSYRGIRHELGLRARGQRTRCNNRIGLSLGVSKKRVSK